MSSRFTASMRAGNKMQITGHMSAVTFSFMVCKVKPPAKPTKIGFSMPVEPQEALPLPIQCGDIVRELSTGRLAKMQSMAGENPIANETPKAHRTTEWRVKFLDDAEPQFKTFYDESQIQFVKAAPG